MNKARKAEQNRQWRAANRQKTNEANKRFRESPKGRAYRETRKEASRAARKLKRERIRQFASDVKLYYRCCNPSCPIVGSLPVYCYDFHHLDGSEKSADLGNIISQVGWSKVIAEINKCTCLCAVCHRKHHAGDLDVSDFRPCIVTTDRKIGG